MRECKLYALVVCGLIVKHKNCAIQLNGDYHPQVSPGSTPNGIEGIYWSFQIMRPPFQFSMSTSPVVTLLHNSFKEARGDVTTGVTSRFLTDVEGERAGNDTTWSATQVGPRTTEAGLGGHEDGVWGSTRVSKPHRSRYRNGVGRHRQNCHRQ